MLFKMLFEGNNLFYHGTSTNVVPKGTLKCLPYNCTGNIQEKGRKKNLDKIFFTDSYKSALIYAGRSVNQFGGEPIVYRLIPMGEIEKINDIVGSKVYAAKWGFFEEI